MLGGARLSACERKRIYLRSHRYVDRAGGADLAAEMLGHTSSDITRLHYIEPDDHVNPVTADILEALAPER